MQISYVNAVTIVTGSI